MNPAHTLFLSAPAAADLINRHGIPQTLRGMRDAIAEDFARWADFDKSARVANHRADGVIELMPIADDTLYSFKYVNGHPKNTAPGPVHRDGLRRARRRGHRHAAAAVANSRSPPRCAPPPPRRWPRKPWPDPTAA